jgi:hypothetical protein
LDLSLQISPITAAQYAFDAKAISNEIKKKGCAFFNSLATWGAAVIPRYELIPILCTVEVFH